MNKTLLKSKMILFGDNNSLLASHIGISKQRFSAKINETNGAEFTQSEIAKIKDRYNLTADEVEAIFFKK